MSNVDYKGSVTLISGLTQANNGSFPLVDGDAVQYKQEINEDGTFKSVSQKLSEFNRSYEYATSDDIDGILNGLFGQWKRLSLTEDTMLENTFEDQLKILSVNGNSYQPTSNNIVPTPEKPIPIISKKTNIKRISPNVFDFEKENDTSNIPDSGTYRSIGQYQLKANTKYIFEWSEATVPAKATLSFQIQDDKGTVLVSPFTYFNLETTEKKETGKQVEFTTNESGIVKFAYNCTVATSSTTETYQQYWYTKILKDISLKEDVEYEPEYVELRSLKETGNLFDINFIKLWGSYSDGMTILDDGTVKVTNNDATLWPLKTKSITIPKSAIYTIKYDFETISGGANSGWISLVNMSNDNSKIFSTSGKTLYLDAGDYYVRFYRGQGATDVENNIVQYSNIVLVEGTSAPSTYVAPTVRDYKIVDHANKTAKIVRNVGIVDNNYKCQFHTQNDNYISFIIDALFYDSTMLSMFKLGYTNLFEVNEWVGLSMNKECNWISTGSFGFILNKSRNITTTEQAKEFLTNNNAIFLYKLRTPTEEQITYVETDISEVGYSWQDTTSPSPDVPSDIEGVNEIDITVTGKNLFDINDEDVYLSPNITHNGNQIIKNDGSIFPRIKLKNLVIDKEYTLSYSTKLNKSISDGQLLSAISSKNMGYPDGVILYKVGDGGTDYNVEIKFTATQSEMYLIFSIQPETITNLQIELGDIVTDYEPYKPPQFLSYQLATPLKGINNTKDIIDIESNQRTDNLTTFVLDDKTIKSIILGTTKEKTQVFQLGISDIFNNNDIWCDKLKNDSNKDEELFTCQSGELYIAIYKGRLETVDVDGFKKWLKDNPLTFTGSATTPTQETLPEDLPTELNKLKTNDGSTAIYINGEVKPSLNIEYKGT